jgi:hypothetical protein
MAARTCTLQKTSGEYDRKFADHKFANNNSNGWANTHFEGDAEGVTLRVTEGLCDLDSDADSEAARETEAVEDWDTDDESEIVALELAAGVGVIVGVTLADSDASGGTCEKSRVVDVMGNGLLAVPLKKASDPIAKTTVVDPARLICASPASPLSALRVHVITVVPPDCVHVNPDVPVVAWGMMSPAERAVITYCWAVPPLSGQMTTFVLGVSVIRPFSEIPTAILRATPDHFHKV